MERVHISRAESNDQDVPLLDVDDLTIDYWQDNRWVNVVNQVAFAIRRGEVFGLAGESGCGKTTAALALLGHHQPGSRIRSGEVRFEGEDMLRMAESRLRRIRGARIGFVPQDPSTALGPHLAVGDQIVECSLAHGATTSRADARERMMHLLRQVRMPQPARAASKYPHQFSGGQQQRIAIALALSCSPDAIILDEPTTALDVTTQSQILELLLHLRADFGLSMLYVTHNLGVMASIADRVGIMYAGELVEIAPIRELFHSPLHPYTRGLIAAVPKITAPTERRRVALQGLLERDKLPVGCRLAPRCGYAEERCFVEHQSLEGVGPEHGVACHRWHEVELLVSQGTGMAHSQPTKSLGVREPRREMSILHVENLSCAYVFSGLLPRKRKPQTVVKDITLEIGPRETFALVGESGSGKSTIARAISGLLLPVGGEIVFDGNRVTTLVEQRDRETRRGIQIIFQNPSASLNPRRRVGAIVGRPLEVFFGLAGKAMKEQVLSLLDSVNLDPAYASRFPDQLSGGEQQRVAIARALAAHPKLILCDEVLSALDVSVQASVLELLLRLQDSEGVAYLFISHDLAVVRSIAHRLGVLYQGEMWEVGKVEEVFRPPSHPYTEALLTAVPEANPDWRPRRETGLEEEPIQVDGTQGCPFAARCTRRTGHPCHESKPKWQQLSSTHFIRCHVAFEELYSQQLTPGRAQAEKLTGFEQ